MESCSHSLIVNDRSAGILTIMQGYSGGGLVAREIRLNLILPSFVSTWQATLIAVRTTEY